MKKLILIRHGETEYTKASRYCGQKQTPLNSEGVRQAKRLCRKMKNVKVDRIYSSDLKRAFQTASIAFKNREILKKRCLREIDFGRFFGLTFDEASSRYPGAYKNWISKPQKAKIPGGESVAGFAKRVTRCFKRIFRENPGKTAAIVTHGGVIHVLLLYFRGQGLDKFWSMFIKTTEVNTIRFKNGKK